MEHEYLVHVGQNEGQWQDYLSTNRCRHDAAALPLVLLIMAKATVPGCRALSYSETERLRTLARICQLSDPDDLHAYEAYCSTR